ncbi:hypothetical protein chiPu_0023050, partial [Chiloscyllium punctatum]|nr:hypothetical protein [Chiloscyllium punctatum]
DFGEDCAVMGNHGGMEMSPPAEKASESLTARAASS